MPRIDARQSRRLRRAGIACLIALAFSAALYGFNWSSSLYCKGPSGWYVALWHGQVALGRSNRPFQHLGLEFSPSTSRFRFDFAWEGDLVGRQIAIPLWLPLPVFAAIGVLAWWRWAVQRGLAQHWPVPSMPASSTGQSTTAGAVPP